MKQALIKILPADDHKRKWVAVGITVFIAGLLSVLSIYGMGDYGVALFVLIPLFMGANPTILYGLKKHITVKESFRIGLLSLAIYTVGLLLLAMEGVICIVMAAPIGVILTLIGSSIGCAIVKKIPDDSTTTLMILIAIIPTLAFVEKDMEPAIVSVTTSIEINADLKAVWNNVVEFPQLNEPTEFIFKTGIAYPINAKIEGTGVGAVRHCNFTTGSFVEPITIWNEPSLLAFDVLEQPAPMKELSFWDIDAPHLHDYFVSKKGQFRLTELPNGNVSLEGTTWYYHNIKPAFYWRPWSDYIIHKIHERVLKHIKDKAEGEK